MLSDVKEYYGLTRDLGQSGYFETTQSQQSFKELRLAIKEGKLVALSGIVGSGKTTTPRRIQDTLIQEKEILVAKSLAIEKSKINLSTLMMALFFDLAPRDQLPPERTQQLSAQLLAVGVPL
jgi:type II secretory pathway predicted ATPase ExeA